MAGKSPVVINDEQRAALAELSQSRDRAEADRARADAALAVAEQILAEQILAEQILAEPVANRPNWTLARLSAEIETRAGVRLSPAHLSVVLPQRGRSARAGPATS